MKLLKYLVVSFGLASLPFGMTAAFAHGDGLVPHDHSESDDYGDVAHDHTRGWDNGGIPHTHANGGDGTVKGHAHGRGRGRGLTNEPGSKSAK